MVQPAPLGLHWLTRLEALPVPRLRGYGRDSSLLLWSWLLWGLGQGLWSYLWPVYLASLGASSIQVGMVVASNFLVATLCYVPGGYVAQLGHHKWQMFLGHLLPILAVGSFGLAGKWWHVLPGVVVIASIGLVAPSVNSLIVQIADDEHVPAPRFFTMLGVTLYAAMIATPPIGGWVGDRLEIRLVFPLVSLCYAGSVFLMGMVGSRPMPVDGEEAAGAARRGAFSAGSRAYRELLGAPAIRLFLLTAFLLHAGMHLGLSFAPLYLGDVYGWGSAQIGWVGSAASAGTVLLLLTMDRFRRRFGAVPATWLSAGCMAAHFGCTIVSSAVPVQTIGFLCRGGFQSVATLTTVALTEAVSRARVAPAIALQATVAAGAAILAPPLGGWLYARAPAAPFVAAIAVLALTAPLVPRALRAPSERRTPPGRSQ